MPEKSSSAKVFLVHGTWGRGRHSDKASGESPASPRDPRWFENGSKFFAVLNSGLSGIVQATDMRPFLWSGANSIEERRIAAERLAKALDDNVAAAPDLPHFVIAHSHGGNVAIAARHAMSGDVRNVHIVTMATPFLSIYKNPLRTADKIFATCIAFGLTVLGGTLFWWWAWRAFSNLALPASLYLCACISLLSLLFLAPPIWISRLYRKIRKTARQGWLQSKGFKLAEGINNRSLLATIILLAAGSLLLGKYAIVSLPVLLPTLLVLFALIPAVWTALYGGRQNIQTVRQSVPNLTILRSRGDEASLALFLGRITSLLAHAAGTISIIVPIAAAVLAALILYFVADYVLLLLHRYHDCVATGKSCFIPGELAAAFLIEGLSFADSVIRYLLFGVGFCVALVLLTTAFKSLYGKELLFGSLNARVDVFDTPGGSKRYSIDWCARVNESVFGLHHSLYNNPDAVRKIIAHIARVCADGPIRKWPVLEPLAANSSGQNWRGAAAAFVAAAGLYSIVVDLCSTRRDLRLVRVKLLPRAFRAEGWLHHPGGAIR